MNNTIKLKTATAFTALLLLFSGIAVAQDAENTKLRKNQQTIVDKILPDIQIPDLSQPLAVTSPDRGQFVAGETVHLKAEQLCMEKKGIREFDYYSNPGIWLRVQDPSGEIVFDDIIQDYEKTAGPGEIIYVKADTCYSWSGDWNIPSDIGGQSGSYKFTIWEVDDRDDETGEDYQTDSLGDRWKKISNPETAKFSIDPGKQEDNPPDAEVEIKNNQNPRVGEQVVFTAEESTDDNGIEDYWWTVDGNLKTTLAGEEFKYTFDNAGKHTVKVETHDTAGQRTTDRITVRVDSEKNQDPEAQIRISKTNPSVGEEVTINGKRSTDSDGRIIAYNWNIGRDVGKFDHIFSEPGRKTVELKVVDNEGGTDTVSRTINVQENQDPEAKISVSNRNPSTGEQVTFSASQSNDPDSKIIAYNWNIGKDQEEFSHAFDSPGEKTVELEVVSENGATDTASVTIDVQNQDPEAGIQVSNSNPIVGETVSFSADESSDPDGEIIAYNWNIGNTDRRNIDHVFESTGEKTVELEVTDDRGGTDTASVSVNVRAKDSDGDGIRDKQDECSQEGDQGFGLKDNGCPIRDSDGDSFPDPDDQCPDEEGIQELNGCANDKPEVSSFIVSKSQAETGEQLTAEVSASDPNDQDLQYSWSIPGADVGSSAEVSFSFKKTGTKTITVEVGDGITSVTREQTVTVVQPEPAENKTKPQPPETNETTPGPEPGEPGDETPGDGETEPGEQDLGPIQTFVFSIVDLIGGIL